MHYTRILAQDVAVGDYIGRAKTHPFHKVTRVHASAASVWIYLDLGEGGQTRIRPARNAKLWKRTPSHRAEVGDRFALHNEDGSYALDVVALEATPGAEVGPDFVLIVGSADPALNYTAGVPMERLVRKED